MKAAWAAAVALALAVRVSAMPDLAQGHADQAERLARAGRRLDACAELQAALQLAPGRQDWGRRLQELRGSSAAAAPAAVSAAAGAAVDSQVLALLEQARQGYRGSDLAGAQTAWQQVLALKPGQSEARAGLDRLRQEAFHHDADQPFDQSVGDLYDAALRELRKERYVEARQRLLDAKALNPVQAQVLQALGWVEDGARSQQGRRDALDGAAEGRRHAAEGDDAKAAAAFKRALEAQPDLAEARQGLEEVRARNADKVAAALARGRAALAAKDWAGAEKGFSLALALDPEQAEALAGRSQAQARLDAVHGQALRRSAADGAYNQGVEAWQAGDLAAAAQRFNEALRSNPDDADAARALAAVRKRLDAQDAESRAEAAGLLKEGRRLEAAGALEEALRCYQRAGAKDPSLAEAQDGQARVEKRMKGL